MAKELPYFRFTPQEWQNGDISLESYELRGLFIDVCCYYWINDCSIALAKLEKRYNNNLDLLKQLLKLKIIQLDESNEFVSINFLNEQFNTLLDQRKLRQNAGSKGGKQKHSNAKAMLKQKSSYKDKDKDKDNIEARSKIFGENLTQFITSENRDEVIKFWKYWTEPNKSNTKLRFELQKTWDTKRRLDTWFSNIQKYKK